MKNLNILVLLSVLAFSSMILAQEKKAERPKEVEKTKETEKLKTTDPHGFIFKFFGPPRGARQKTYFLPPFADVTDVEVVVSKDNKDESEENICLPGKILEIPGEVTTRVHNPLEAVLTYNYIVSGGRIIGSGAKVFWDLRAVKPGTYTIMAAVDDGCGFCGKTITKIVTVK
jgi:hypothetical protein